MISDFIKFVENEKLKVDSIVITADRKRYEHNFTTPTRRNVRSLSKTVSALGIFKAMEERLFNIDSYVMPFFKSIDIYNESNIQYLSKLQIKHLLCLSIGHDKSFMLRRNYKALSPEVNNISYILNRDIVHEPGTFFVYDNAATYLLSALVEKVTDRPFDEFVYERVLQYLNIEKPKWEKCNQGICLGSTGLYLNNEEVHKIGLMLLNRGQYGEKQIVKSSWADSMHKPHIYNADFEKYDNVPNNKLRKIAYGYHIWVCGDRTEKYPGKHYFGDGAEGQFLIISPEQKMVISVLSREKNMGPLVGELSKFIQ
ncbi:MAG TPA: serine hydrolase [Anaerovoracaceae bacterium]|nr:serine hydrolase [Anaerovoracaceae bacterium]